MSPAFLQELRAKAQDGIANRMFAEADDTNQLLRTLGKEIADKCGCVPVFAQNKKREGRATEKVAGEYGGDWYELKDVVRMTIVAPNMAQLRVLQREIRTRCVISKGLGLIKDVETHGGIDACGYSGLNFVVRLSNGRPGEIQANIPEVIYAKMKGSSFRRDLGWGLWIRIKFRYMLEGGLGHKLYDIYRKAPTTPAGQAAARISKMYYAYFRGFPNFSLRTQIVQELEAFRKTQPTLLMAD
jgi:hypothetical protein